MEALADTELCDHFHEEPSMEVATRSRLRIIRVGTACEGQSNPVRPRSIGITTYRKHSILWATDLLQTEQFFFARVRNAEGEWSDILHAATALKLVEKCIRAAGAPEKSRVSAAEFFGYNFFAKIRGKYTFPPVPASARCFRCAAEGQERWRFDETTLARTCEVCRVRKKRKASQMDDNEEDDHGDRGRLFASAIISTGLTFHKVQELFLKAELDLPISEKQFYNFQKKFTPYIAS